MILRTVHHISAFMSYHELESVTNRLSGIQKEIDFSQNPECLNALKGHLRQLEDSSIWSYGLRRIVIKIQAISFTLASEVRSMINLRIHQILEKHMEKWFLSWNDQVYNVLDIVFGYDTAKCDFLDAYDENWFGKNKNRFIAAAQYGYSLAIKQSNIGVAEKITLLYPEFATDNPH